MQAIAGVPGTGSSANIIPRDACLMPLSLACFAASDLGVASAASIPLATEELYEYAATTTTRAARVPARKLRSLQLREHLQAGRISRASASAALADLLLVAPSHRGSFKYRRFQHEHSCKGIAASATMPRLPIHGLLLGLLLAAKAHHAHCGASQHAACSMQGQRCPLHIHPPAARQSRPSAADENIFCIAPYNHNP